MRDEKEGRSKQDQTNNTPKQHSTPKAVTFPKKTELPRVRLHVHVGNHNCSEYIKPWYIQVCMLHRTDKAITVLSAGAYALVPHDASMISIMKGEGSPIH